MSGMSTDPGAQEGTVPPEAAAASDGNVDAASVALPDQTYEQIHEQASVRLAVIIDEWHKARDALLRG